MPHLLPDAFGPRVGAQMLDKGATSFGFIRPGEELCLSYVETSLPTAERKAHLLAHFGFECGCTRCAKE